jgi:hypothetical protein
VIDADGFCRLTGLQNRRDLTWLNDCRTQLGAQHLP